MALAADMVELHAPGRDLLIRARLGEGEVDVTGSVGGWENVPRPGRRPLTVWRGHGESLTLAIPLLLDRWSEDREDRSVEPQITTLERMAGVDIADAEPPTLKVTGKAVPHDSEVDPQHEWVITGLDWGAALRGATTGLRYRQAVVVTITVFRQDERLATIRKRMALYRYVKAQDGDTYERIAKRELKAKRLAPRLARLNGGRSTDTKLKTGKRVKLPTGSLLRDWLTKGLVGTVVRGSREEGGSIFT